MQIAPLRAKKRTRAGDEVPRVILQVGERMMTSATFSASFSLLLFRPVMGMCCSRSCLKERGCCADRSGSGHRRRAQAEGRTSTHGIHSVPRASFPPPEDWEGDPTDEFWHGERCKEPPPRAAADAVAERRLRAC